MKKFEFKLETVHKVREIRKQNEAVLLAELQRDVEQAAAKVSTIEMLRQEALENYTQRLTSGQQLNAREMELNSNHFTSLSRLQNEAEAELQQKRALCEKQVAVATHAMREVKVTDRLRETQYGRHRSEFARREQSGVDDHVAGMFARRLIEAK